LLPLWDDSNGDDILAFAIPSSEPSNESIPVASASLQVPENSYKRYCWS